MIVDLDPLAYAYLLAREAAHNAPLGATGGAGGPHMTLHRADMAWQAIGCRALAVAPEAPASDLVGLAARSCTACIHYREDGEEWECPLDAYEWAHAAGMELDATEWPPGVPACPSFRVRA